MDNGKIKREIVYFLTRNKMGKREYKITKSNLGYNVYRKKELEDWTIRLERLQRDNYTLHREFARTFYHLDDAVSNLTLARIQWEKIGLNSSIEKKESEKKSEKTSWSE